MEKKRQKFLIIIIILAGIILALFLPGYTKLQNLITENKRLENEISSLKESVEQLKEEKEKLEDDISYIEKVARDRLGVVRKDEMVIEKKR